MTEPPKLSVPSLSRVFETRKELIEILSLYENDRIDEIDLLVEAVADVLPTRISRKAIEESLRGLVDLKLTKELIASTAHRLAGNIRRLAAGRAAPVWACQRFLEWVPVQIMAVSRQNMKSRSVGESQGVVLTLKVMAGTSCPLILKKWKSLRWMFHFASKMGFSTRTGRSRPNQFPYQVPEQYVSLRMAVLVEPRLSSVEPGFKLCDVNTALRKWNKEVTKRRLRVDGYKCPEKYPSTVPCYRCWRGYTSCPAGTHRLDFVRGACKRCDKVTMLDTEQGHLCIKCLYVIASE